MAVTACRCACRRTRGNVRNFGSKRIAISVERLKQSIIRATASCTDHAATTEKAKAVADPIGDWIYDVRWEPKNRQPAESRDNKPPAGRWLVFMDATGVGGRLIGHLENAGLPCVRVKPDEPVHLETMFTDHAGTDAAEWAGIVDLRALDVKVDDTLAASALIDLECALCEPVSELVRRITAVSGIGSPKLWLGDARRSADRRARPANCPGADRSLGPGAHTLS